MSLTRLSYISRNFWRPRLVNFFSSKTSGNSKILNEDIMKMAKEKIKSQGYQLESEAAEQASNSARKLPNQSAQSSSSVSYVFLGVLASLAGTGSFFLMRPLLDESEDITKLPLLSRLYQRAYLRVMGWYKYMVDPDTDSLLPEPFPPGHPMYRKKTLLLELDKTLIYSSWDKDKGWTVAKRPWADYFISYLAHFYEIVIFTSQTPFYAAPIIDKLHAASHGGIMYRLYRDSSRYNISTGDLVKDISILNRDPAHVILMDPEKSHYESTQPENAILVPEWKGDANDTWLLDMIGFLEMVATNDVSDVREVLKNFPEGKEIPKAYSERIAAVYRSRREEYEKSVKNAQKHTSNNGNGSGGAPAEGIWATTSRAVASLFGFQPAVPARAPPSPEEFVQQEAIRHQQTMQELEKIRKMQEAEAKQAEEEYKRMMESANNVKVTLWDLMSKGVDAAIQEKASPEVREYMQKMAAMQAQGGA